MRQYDEDTYLRLLRAAGAPHWEKPAVKRTPLATNSLTTPALPHAPAPAQSPVVHRGQTLPATVPFPENAILRILKYVARHRDVPFTWLLSDTRQKQVVLARHMAMWIASVLTERSLSEIGMRCNRDHTTVLSGLKRIEHLRTINPAFRAELDTLREGTKTMLRETGYAPHKG